MFRHSNRSGLSARAVFSFVPIWDKVLHNRLLLVLDREHPLHFACDRLAKMLGFGVLLRLPVARLDVLSGKRKCNSSRAVIRVTYEGSVDNENRFGLWIEPFARTEADFYKCLSQDLVFDHAQLHQ